MAVFYRLVSKVNLSQKEGEPKNKFYPIPKSQGVTDFASVCKLIQARSTMSAAEVRAVLDNLLFVMEVELSAGRSIRLDGFGTFRPSLSSQGAELKKDYQRGMITKARILFNPGKEIKSLYEDITFRSADATKDDAATESEAA